MEEYQTERRLSKVRVKTEFHGLGIEGDRGGSGATVLC